jgi:hypothetical protein
MSNEGGEAFFYTWKPIVTPLGCSPSVIQSRVIEHLKGGALLGFWDMLGFW